MDTLRTHCRGGQFGLLRKHLLQKIAVSEVDQIGSQCLLQQTTGRLARRLRCNASGRDRTHRYLVFLCFQQNNITVSVMILGSLANLAPLPPKKCDQVRVCRISDSITLPYHILDHSPVPRHQILRMVSEAPEIQIRAITSIVAGICRRVCTFTVHHR